jgi:hypothetical protein
MLNRLDTTLDAKLRAEQAGFRRGRGCTDQIFTLRNIIEQCQEWKAPLYITYIDFKKAFDSIHRDSLWKILRSYGVPQKFVSLIRCFYDDYKCAIQMQSGVSDWFSVKTGVRQGCIISPILFLVILDWVMRKTCNNQPCGIQWNLFSHLEDLDFADDIALLSSKQQHMQDKVNRLAMHAEQVGLHINIKKTQEMRMNTPETQNITVNGEALETVDDFVYLGAIMSTEDPTKKDIKRRLGLARTAFVQLNRIWKSSQISERTKIRLYNSNIKSVLLYGSETWRVTKTDMKALATFHHRCLRRICKVFWPNIISNNDILNRTHSTCIIQEIRKRRWRWLGHTLRMPPTSICKTALRWTPQGKRPRGRPKTTWRKTITDELHREGLSWGEAETKAKDRKGWRDLVETLCSSRSEEDK